MTPNEGQGWFQILAPDSRSGSAARQGRILENPNSKGCRGPLAEGLKRLKDLFQGLLA